MLSRNDNRRWFARQWVRAHILTHIRSFRARAIIALSSGKEYQIKRAEDAWRHGDSTAAERIWRELSVAEPRSAEWPMKLSASAKGRGDFEAAERVLLDAIDRGVESDAVDDAAIRLGRWRRRSNEAIEQALALVADPRTPPNRTFYTSVFLAAHDQVEAARAGFRRALGQGQLDVLARAQLAGLDILEDARKRGQSAVSGWLSPAENAILVRESASDTLVVAFAPPEGLFGVPVNVLHAMLSDTSVNALYLFDSQQLGHLRGSDRFGPGYEAMLDGVRALVAELGTRRLIVLGASLAGVTALQALLDLKADGALLFSPVTNMSYPIKPEMTRMPQLWQRLTTLVPGMLKDPRPELEARQCCDRIEVYYGGANPPDCLHATVLAATRGVVLHEMAELDRHDCIGELALRGRTNLLRDLLQTE
ncbi:MAG: hypothetical protein JSR60_15395 [Proteobacteria bacterium]|nr:hypothetical protein [Pseudomonadota bacterium]